MVFDSLFQKVTDWVRQWQLLGHRMTSGERSFLTILERLGGAVAAASDHRSPPRERRYSVAARYQLAQFPLHPGHHVLPIPQCGLAKQTGRGIPGAILAFPHPAPIRR